MSESKRTSITVDKETKEVFDWSMEKEESKTTSIHLRKVLQEFYGEKSWKELAAIAHTESCVCPQHNKPYTHYCKDCNTTLCLNCDLGAHKGHNLQYFCRKHEIGYDMDKGCPICEKEKWETVVKVSKITVEGLKDKIGKSETESDSKLVVIDTREDDEWAEGHLNEKYTYHIKWLDFKNSDSEGYIKLEKVLQEHEDSYFIVMSQGYPQKKKKETSGSVRGFLAAVDLQLVHGVKEVAFLDGGWTAFHSQYPNIVTEHKKNGKCRICEYYHKE